MKSGKVPSTSPGEEIPLVKGQGEWKILSASSEEPDTGFAHFAIDGNPDTYWHTSYTNGLPGFPPLHCRGYGNQNEVYRIYLHAQNGQGQGPHQPVHVFRFR